MSGAPPVSIDEAIELFMAMMYPGGLPEGVDGEALVAALRAKVAADRPEWAAMSPPPPAPPASSPAPGYSQLKAAAVEKARQAEIPSDPEERYLEERRQEARRNRERREEEAEEAAARERLIRNLMAEKKEADPGPLRVAPEDNSGVAVAPPEVDEELLARALRIRKLLVARMERLPAASVGSAEVSGPGQPAVGALGDLAVDEQVRVLRELNASKRATLKRRDDLMAERRPKSLDLQMNRFPRPGTIEPIERAEAAGLSLGTMTLSGRDRDSQRRRKLRLDF